MGITNTTIYSTDVNIQADFFKIIGHPARLSMLRILQKYESADISQIALLIPLAKSTLRNHLMILKDNLLIEVIIVEKRVCYKLHITYWPLIHNILKACEI